MSPDERVQPFAELRNEFAWVDVIIDHSGNGPRLLVKDRLNGQQIFLDPLELSAFANCSHDDFAPFMEALRPPGGHGRSVLEEL